MDESASQTPPSHSTSFLSFATINSRPLFLSTTLFFPSPPHLSSCLLTFPDSRPCLAFPPLSYGDYISWNSERKRNMAGGRSGSASDRGKFAENPTLTSILSSLLTFPFALFALRRASKSRGRGMRPVAWWTSEDIENINPGWNCAKSAWYDWNSVWGHDSAAVGHAFHTSLPGCARAVVAVAKSRQKTLNISDLPSVFSIIYAAFSFPPRINHTAAAWKA